MAKPPPSPCPHCGVPFRSGVVHARTCFGKNPDIITEGVYQSFLWVKIGARPDTRLWRQNSGTAVIQGTNGPRGFKGAPKGAADLSGIVRPEGRRLEIEVKGPDYAPNKARDADQKAWRELIESFGGIYIFARYDKGLSLHENVLRVDRELTAAIEQKRSNCGAKEDGISAA